jgi:hypothetical protein
VTLGFALVDPDQSGSINYVKLFPLRARSKATALDQDDDRAVRAPVRYFDEVVR